jgi:integrase
MSRKTRNGKWQAVWRVPLPDGSSKQETRTFDLKRDADAHEAQLRVQVRRGAHFVPTQETLAQYLRRWLAWREPFIELATYTRLQRQNERYIIPVLGGYKVADLNPTLIESFLHQLITVPQYRKPLAPQSAKLIFQHLNHAYLDGVQRGELTHNPCERVVKSGIVGIKIRLKPNPLSPDEVHRILSVARGTHWYAFLLLLVSTGMRRGEALALQWERVDLELGIVHVTQTVKLGAVRGDYIKVGVPKGKSSRSIPLTPGCVLALVDHRKITDEWAQRRVGWIDQGWVFPGENGGLKRPQTIYPGWQILLRKAGVRRVRIHDLRHTFGTALVASHPDVIEAAKIMGHKGTHTLLEVYAHGLGQRTLMVNLTAQTLGIEGGQHGS